MIYGPFPRRAIYILCAPTTQTNPKTWLLVSYQLTPQADRVASLLITENSAYPITTPAIIFATLTDSQTSTRKNYIVLYSQSTPADVLTQAAADTPNNPSNGVFYFIDVTSTLGFTRQPRIAAWPTTSQSFHKLLALSYNRGSLLVSFIGKSSIVVGVVSICSPMYIDSDVAFPSGITMSSLTCSNVLTDTLFRAGSMAVGVDPEGTIGTLYSLDMTESTTSTPNRVYRACSVTIAVQAGLNLANCKSTKAVSTIDDKTYGGFVLANQQYAIFLTDDPTDSKDKIVDILSLDNSPATNNVLGSARRRASLNYLAALKDTAYFSDTDGANIVSISYHNRPGYVLFSYQPGTDRTTQPSMVTPTGTDTLQLRYDAYSLLDTDTPTVSKGLTLNSISRTLNASTGFYSMIPLEYPSSSPTGTQLTYTSLADAETIISYYDVMNVTIDGLASNSTTDNLYPVAGGAVAHLLNNTNRTSVRFYNCVESEGYAPMRSSCNFLVDFDIRGKASNNLNFYLGVQNGTYTKDNPQVEIEDKITQIITLQDHDIVQLEDNTTSSISYILLHQRRNRTTQYFNLSRGYKNMTFLDFQKDLYVAGIIKDQNVVVVYRAAGFNLSLLTEFKRIDKLLETGDFCPKGIGLHGEVSPRLVVFSQCAALESSDNSFYIWEEELVNKKSDVLRTKFYSDDTKLIGGTANVAKRLNSCLAKGIMIYWEVNEGTSTGARKVIWAYSSNPIVYFALEFDQSLAFGISSITKITCLQSQAYFLVEGLDTSNKVVLILVDVLAADVRNKFPWKTRIDSAVSRLTITSGDSNYLYISYLETVGTSQNWIMKRLRLKGPTFYVKSITNRTLTASFKAQALTTTDSVTTQTTLSYTGYPLTFTSENKAKLAYSTGVFDLEQAIGIYGPLFSGSFRGINSDIATFFPRLGLLQMMNYTMVASTFKVSSQVGARLESSNTESNLTLFRDPTSPKKVVTLDFLARPSVLGLSTDSTQVYAFALMEGYNSQDEKMLYLMKEPLLPNTTDSARGRISPVYESTDNNIKIYDDSIALVAQYQESTSKAWFAVFDIRALSTSNPQLNPLATRKLKSSRLFT